MMKNKIFSILNRLDSHKVVFMKMGLSLMTLINTLFLIFDNGKKTFTPSINWGILWSEYISAGVTGFLFYFSMVLIFVSIVLFIGDFSEE